LKIENDVLNQIFTFDKDRKKYLLLPNYKTPRIIIPLYSWKIFKAALKVQNTASLINRLLKNIISILFPIVKILPLTKVSIRPSFEDTLKEDLGKVGIKNLFEFAFYIGTAGSANRKITLLLLDSSGNSMGILKYPLSSESSNFISKEYDTLKDLSNSSFANFIHPKKFQLILFGKKTSLFQEDIFKSTTLLTNVLNEEIVNASLELSNKTELYDLTPYLDKLLHQVLEISLLIPFKKALQKHLQNITDNNIPLVTIHGDFVLYNMQKKESKLVLIDWEFSRSGLPLFDIFHFVFQGKYQIQKMNVENCLQEVFSGKNVSYFKYYLKNLSIEADIINSLFFIYLIESLLFDLRIKPEPKLEDRHYYRALQIIGANY